MVMHATWHAGRLFSAHDGVEGGWRSHWHARAGTSSRSARLIAAAGGSPGSSAGGSLAGAPGAGPAGAPAAWLQQQVGSLGRRAGSALLAAALATAAVQPLPAGAVTEEQLLFLEAWRAVDRAYVDKSFNGQSWFRVRERALKDVPMANREQTYAAIRTLLASLNDPFTRLLDPDQYAALKSSTAGTLTGVGVEVSFDTAPSASSSASSGSSGRLVVVAPAPGGPADRAGIKPRDQILAIDGQPTGDLSLYAAGNLLKGPVGTSVTLTVSPAAGGPQRELVLEREPIRLNPVESALCGSGGRAFAAGGKLGYIRIASFSKFTSQGVREAIGKLKAAGAEAYVLDIRSNGGGLFPAGVEVARMWMDRGDVVLIADSEGVRDVYEADGTALEPRAPLAVLVNRGTASAAEVLAGALKDNGRAQVAGEPTFGKGLIQTLVPLSDGSALAVTVAKYQTPAGVDINKVGISPQLALDGAALAAIPSTGDAFCAFAQTEAAPPLLGGR